MPFHLEVDNADNGYLVQHRLFRFRRDAWKAAKEAALARLAESENPSSDEDKKAVEAMDESEDSFYLGQSTMEEYDFYINVKELDLE